MSKKNMFGVVRILAFMMVFTVLLHLGSLILTPHTNDDQSGMVGYITKGYKGEPKDSIDVLLIGNSALWSGFSPVEFWNNTGATSYASGKPNQTVDGAYKVLKDALTYQSPKVVVLEADMFYPQPSKPEQSLITKIHKRIFELKKLYKETFSNVDESIGTAISYKFPILKYHEKWKEMGAKELFDLDSSFHYIAKGFVMKAKVTPYEQGFDYMKHDTQEIERIPEKNLKYLDKIIALCDKNNIRLELVNFPAAYSWSNERHNGMKKCSDERAVPYIDLNLIPNEFGFDWRTDSRDGGIHLNLMGAEKLTKYYGEILSEKYSLENHKNDSAYANWKIDAKEYEQARLTVINDESSEK